MYKIYALVVVMILAVTVFDAKAQTANPAPAGTAKGLVRDTVQNYVLKSATVSVYKAADSTLISYQVTNNYGEFSFKTLPINIPLRIDISHVGYLTYRKNFTIPTGKNIVDLGTIVAERRDVMLKDVEISVPPISMNGDTLEFNASAFKLDSNAVVEDLLRKIPNVTLWGDGKITVNGREVKSLLVNGKSFFGGDLKIATQNLSKNSVQKIQVYNTARDQQSTRADSTLEMNIKLKKGKDIGFFGKVGIGYGSDNRYEADASINMYSPKMQLALVGAMNNINKTANSMNSLMANSTFKGVGTNVEYQPDFRATGINRPRAAGANFAYDFIEKPTYQKKSTLKANYFIQDRNSDNLTETQTTTSINSTDKNIEKGTNISTSSNTNQRFDSGYELAKKGHRVNLNQAVNFSNGEDIDQTFRSAGTLQDALTSTNNSLNTSHNKSANYNVNGSYYYSPSFYTDRTRFTGLSMDFRLQGYENEGKRVNITEFKSFIDATQNQKFNRKYDTKSNGSNQELNLTIPNLQKLLFVKARFARINFKITNKLSLKTDDNDNRVEDLDTLTNTYRPNAYLNNRVKTNLIEETPGLGIERSFQKSLSNRYYKSMTIRFHPKMIMMSQDNRSDRSFQNIKRNYRKFVPDAGIDYYNYQYGEYSRSYNLNYSTTLKIPTIQQLAPLTDSTNLYYLQRGNINLRKSVQQTLSFSFSHDDQRSKNTLNYYFRATGGFISDNIVDSLIIDDQNRRTVFQVNADGHKYLTLYGYIRKAYKFKTSELQLDVNTDMNTNRNPGYTNNVFTYSTNLNTNSNFNVNYTYKSYLAMALNQSFSTYKSRQEAFNTGYNGKNLGTTLSSSYNVTKKFTLNSNITFNNSSSSNTKDINFTIWNASAVYRFLKGNNAEFKFSALDLLRQNSSVINYGTSNSFTVGTQNVLQQYFMATISYYPRQFGKKAAKK
nr:hypothetical protein [Pedobacter panaciterrae]